MKVMGLFCFVLSAICLLSTTMAAPAPLDAISTIALGSTGLVITAASGAVTTIPAATLLLGKAVAVKGLVLKSLASNN